MAETPIVSIKRLPVKRVSRTKLSNGMFLEISLLPINDELQKHLEKDSLVFRHDQAHPNVKGHKVIGNRLCEFLLDTHLK